MNAGGSIKVRTFFAFSIEFRTSTCAGGILNALPGTYPDFFEVGFNSNEQVCVIKIMLCMSSRFVY